MYSAQILLPISDKCLLELAEGGELSQKQFKLNVHQGVHFLQNILSRIIVIELHFYEYFFKQMGDNASRNPGVTLAVWTPKLHFIFFIHKIRALKC